MISDEGQVELKLCLDRLVQLLSSLYAHPDLPKHGDTRPLLLAAVAQLKAMNEILSRTAIVISGHHQ